MCGGSVFILTGGFHVLGLPFGYVSGGRAVDLMHPMPSGEVFIRNRESRLHELPSRDILECDGRLDSRHVQQLCVGPVCCQRRFIFVLTIQLRGWKVHSVNRRYGVRELRFRHVLAQCCKRPNRQL